MRPLPVASPRRSATCSRRLRRQGPTRRADACRRLNFPKRFAQVYVIWRPDLPGVANPRAGSGYVSGARNNKRPPEGGDPASARYRRSVWEEVNRPTRQRAGRRSARVDGQYMGESCQSFQCWSCMAALLFCNATRTQRNRALQQGRSLPLAVESPSPDTKKAPTGQPVVAF